MLQIRFALRSSTVEVLSSPDLANSLAALRSRFPSGSSTSSHGFEVNLDDFLTNVFELATWPADDTDIQWQPELLAIVETNASDSNVVAQELSTPMGQPAPVEFSTLSQDWAAPLTDFQRRDVGKLIELSHGANFSVPGAGKTRATLALFDARRRFGVVNRLLVVCPKSAFESWQFEAQECLNGTVRTRSYDGSVTSNLRHLVSKLRTLARCCAIAPSMVKA